MSLRASIQPRALLEKKNLDAQPRVRLPGCSRKAIWGTICIMEITYFSPGQLLAPRPPLAPYRPAVPTGALGPYLDAYTQPGDLVIDLFCSSPTFLYEAVQAGRRGLGLNVNRALLLAASLGLTAVERQAVVAAFTHLAETRKGPATLQTHIEQLYRTTCATCGATTVADAFIWERENKTPVAKRYRCAACGDAGEVPTNETDRTAADRFEERGLSYWLLLDRAAPGDASYRGRIAALLELYTPRNLSAVSDLLFKYDGLTLQPAVRIVIEALLLDTFDWATSLRPPDAYTSRPRRLQRPARYVEENAWRLFERALETWREMPLTPVPHAPDLEALLAPSEAETPSHLSSTSVHLTPMASRQAGRDLPLDCAALIIVDPPRPDTVLWHLSALWCHWLWGSQAGAPLTPFLSRRWLDKDWLWRGLRGALGAIAPLLHPRGRLVSLFSDENPVILEALTLAAARAGCELVGWGVRAPGEARLTWRFDRSDVGARAQGEADSAVRAGETPASVPEDVDALSRAVAERAAAASLNVLRLRGEPVTWPTIHAAIDTDLAESNLLARVANLPDEVADPLSWLADTVRSAIDGAPLRQIFTKSVDEPLWWLDEPLEPKAAAPLSDRVELAVAEILRDLLAVSEVDLHRRVCARFPGPETPDARLIRLCLFSYGDEHAPGHWRLRSEDDLEVRAAETDAVITDLTSLGRRLGFEVALGIPRAGEWAVRWLDDVSTAQPHVPYVFAVRTTAVLGDILFAPPPFSPPRSAGANRDPGPSTRGRTTPCLTLPGGRAVLVGHKLRNDPRLRQQVAQHGWQFLKFRHLRHLVQEVAAKQLDRYAFQAALGLDPIVEREEAQLALW